MHAPGRIGHRRPGPQRRDCHAEGFRNKHRGSSKERFLAVSRHSKEKADDEIYAPSICKGAAIAPLAVKHLALQSTAGASNTFDIVVAGAGHNSLITAAYLAKAGYRCVVLEGRPKI